MEEAKGRKRRAVPLRTILTVMVAIGLLISCILMFYMYRTARSYQEMRTSTQNYIDCQQIANDLLTGSDALTSYARSFIVSGDLQQAKQYFSDTQAQNAIREAVTKVQAYTLDGRVQSQLNNALQLRDQLRVTEAYAMRLKVASLGEDLAACPAELQGIQLLPADIRLSAEEQAEKSRSFLFDTDYESSRNEISLRINRSMDVLMNGMLTRQVASSDRLLAGLRGQRLLTVSLMLCLLATVLIVFTMVIAPLQRQISKMSSNQELNEEGTSEIRFLARTYNLLHEQNRQASEKLSYEARHDELTGLYNRTAYAAALTGCVEEGAKIALILVDVDLFKSYNDQYGHDVGDAILKSVAGCMMAAFRRNDMVCRIGGDEFAIIMADADSGLQPLIREKLRSIAERLAHPQDDLPAVTLSAGVCFSDQQESGADLFKSADLALYRVKNGSRNGCAFFSASGEIEVCSNT